MPSFLHWHVHSFGLSERYLPFGLKILIATCSYNNYEWETLNMMKKSLLMALEQITKLQTEDKILIRNGD